MTLIIGIDKVINGKHYKIMVGDFMVSDGFTKSLKTTPKVFRRDKFVFGCAGSFRVNQLLKYSDFPEESNSWIKNEKIYNSFIPWIREISKDRGASFVENNKETNVGIFLFYNGKHIYRIQHNYSALREKAGVYAIGSGSYHASAILEFYLSLVKNKKVEFDLKYLVTNIFRVVSEEVVTVSKEFSMLDLTALDK